MSKLESLVPPVELCKLIPAGEFVDSALVRCIDNVGTVVLCERANAIHTEGWQKIPAPTLEEIMAAMPHCRVYKKTAGFYVAVKENERVPSLSGATAALKLWLQQKGIECN